ncbi:MAG: AAA family ATPase [Deltaproteobacteria bacterium]|nr:AAA family ATPase [Deltaproteobacteria bacterium]MBW2342473.1 AAA family ATPase [Deltaproteobacteria bacterium]
MKKHHIGLIGTHGTGKTTYANHIYRKLTGLFPDNTIALVSGIARQCPLPVNRQTSEAAQLWIFHHHIQREIEAKDEAEAEYIICDRTVLDNLAYAEAAGLSDVVDACFPMALWWLEKYTELVWFSPVPGRLTEDGFRDTNPVFQLEIHNILADWIQSFDIFVMEVNQGYKHLMETLRKLR